MTKRAVGASPSDLVDLGLDADAETEMRRVGFLPHEIRRFKECTWLNTYSDTFTQILEDRKKMMFNIRLTYYEDWGEKPSKAQCAIIIKNWYHSQINKDPFVWWHRAYQPTMGSFDHAAKIHNWHAAAVRRTRDIWTGDIKNYYVGAEGNATPAPEEDEE